MNVVSGSFYEAYPNKDHDRHVKNDANLTYAVFDGAGSAHASGIAEVLMSQMLSNGEILKPDLGLESIHDNVRNSLYIDYAKKGRIPLTTASVLRLENSRYGNWARFAHAGDSRIYYNNPSDEFSLLTNDEIGVLTRDGRTYADTRNFIGHPKHQLVCLSSLVMSETCSFALVTDGITDKYKEGRVSDGQIREILRSDYSPENQARQLVEASKIKDDKTAIVVKVEA